MRTVSRISIVSVCALALIGAPSAFAANKDIIALQAQVQQLQDMMTSMQQTDADHYATMHNLLQQTTDNITKISGEVDSMQKLCRTSKGHRETLCNSCPARCNR